MSPTKELQEKVVRAFKFGYSMSEVGIKMGLRTLQVELIIREWMIERESMETSDE